MGSHDETLHLVFFPFLARSHIIPILETARLAAERRVKVTLVTTPANAHLVRPTLDRTNSYTSPSHPPMELRIIPFAAAENGLPDGCENLTVLPIPLAANFFAAVSGLREPLDSLLRDLRPDALISDALLPWTTALASDHGIPRLIFQASGLLPLCAANDLDLYRPYEAVSGRGEPFAIPGFPHPIKLTRAELPEVFDFPYMLGLLREAELTSYGVVVNSFNELEPDYVDHYKKVGPREVFLVGPVTIAGAQPQQGVKEEAARDPCLSWLDGKADDSVVYVSFGTMCRFSDAQLRELALGLEASGHPFLWAVRADGGVAEGWMPEGFDGRGLVARRWVPQRDILAHRAVGGYVLHCGWSSVTDAVCAGVPLVTWPLHSEQFVNEKLLVDVLGVAHPILEGFKSVLDGEKEVVKAETVARSCVADGRQPRGAGGA
ncbi:hypothetical protein C4D60_Mb01t01830 [Musa balbisiana]|uniref:Glycosyltransferase n=1 Tax=Musa balbisiana TaxID=52838 RepID=A0A4S8JJ64_MUSBA|nr:hypothetical protein C4D60_Mb01t01830 [Musa balbisiana]